VSRWQLSDIPEAFRVLGEVLTGNTPRCSGELDHHLVIPTDADGRPGYHLLAPGFARRIRTVEKGVASDFTFMVGARSSLTGVCMPRMDVTLHERALMALENLSANLRALPAVPPGPSELAGVPAVEYTALLSNGTLVTQWQFDRRGWAFAVSLFRHPEDGPEADQLGRAALATWTWLPDDDDVVPGP
jgi:hypothetical protein